MRMTVLPTLHARLDASIAERRKAVAQSVATRIVQMGGYRFEKTPDRLVVTFPRDPRNLYSARIEIVRIGDRYGIIRLGKCEARVSGKGLLAALSDFRQEATATLVENQRSDPPGWDAGYFLP